ncbi:MAG: hypothetical protein OXC18_10370 [Desulfurellaceae bacterium]|nr:hypothetical protein [Desulfurellaceae bacterium]
MTGLICEWCGHHNYEAVPGERCDQCDNVMNGVDDPDAVEPPEIS